MYTPRSFICLKTLWVTTFVIILLCERGSILQTVVENGTFIPVTNASLTQTDRTLERASLLKIICLLL